MNEPCIAILGTVEVIGSGRTTSLPGSNLPTLLSLLALEPGRPVTNDRLIAALWPDTDPLKAGRSLISLVHQLNVTLGAHLGLNKAVTSVKGVGRVLHVDADVVDAFVFERRLDAADQHMAAHRIAEAADMYQAALDLWRGEPFGGADVRALLEPASRLRILRQRAETAMIDASLRTDRGAALVPWTLQRLEADPFDEQRACDAARSLYQAGRSSDALEVLRDCMERQRQRGIAPAPATRELELHVLDHSLDTRTAAVRSPNEVIVPRRFIGRRTEQAALDLWHAAARGPSVMAIHGSAGIGKSALLGSWMQQFDTTELMTMDHLLDRGPAGQPTDVSRHVRFDAVVGRIATSTASTRVLIVDDAQSMTVTSVALIRHLVWHPDVDQLCVVMAIRSPDLIENSALAQLLNDASRSGLLHELRLAPFDLDEVQQLVALSGSTHWADARDLLRLTGGNPRSASSVLSLDAIDDGHSVPADVQAVLGRHLTMLSDHSLRILQCAARLGLEGDAVRLSTSTGSSELDVMDALDEVGRGRLLYVDQIGGSYRFVHELARRAVLIAQSHRASA